MAFWNRRRAEDRALDKQTVPAVMLSSLPGSVTPENALKLADIWAAVRVLSDAAASIPVIPYRRTESGRERITSGRIAQLLERPSPWTTQPNLIAQLMAQLQLHGNAFLGKYRDGDEVAQLGALPPDRIRVELKAGRILFELTGPRGEKSIHTDADIVHIKGMSTDGLIGLSPIRQAATALGLSDSVTQHAVTFFQNDATPRGVLRVGDVNQEQLDDGALRWNAGHKGPENANRIAVIGGEVEYLPLTIPPQDSQLVESRKLSTLEVARIFRLHPHMLGADSGESMTYSNVESIAIEFTTFALQPWLRVIEAALSNDRDLFARQQFCEFKVDGLLRADAKTRAEVYRMALDPQLGWLRRDEVRDLENLPPEPAQVASEAPTNGTGDPAAIAVA